VRELTAGLRSLVNRERLHGASAHIALSSDFCVTRVVAGENESVRKELRSLDERSSLYLLLGTGENKLASCWRPLDAKHQQAWVTVVNKRTLGAVLTAAEAAGIRLDNVEHSLVALARAVGRLEQDRDQPVLVLEINQRGVDVGISYQGQLLIDYRPGGASAKENIAEIVNRHLERLQRFVRRRFRFATGKITRVFLCGEPNDVCMVREQFQAISNLTAEVIDAQKVLAQCNLPATNNAHPTFTPCIGVLALNSSESIQAPSPNLVEDLVSRVRESLWPALAKFAWPVATAAALTLCIFFATLFQKFRCSQLESQLHTLDESRARIARMQGEIGLARQKFLGLSTIERQIQRPQWTKLIIALGASIQEGVWLESIEVDGATGAVKLAGTSNTEDGVYDFHKKLREQPILQNVAIEGTQSAQFNNSGVLKFRITADLSSRITNTEDSKKDR